MIASPWFDIGLKARLWAPPHLTTYQNKVKQPSKQMERSFSKNHNVTKGTKNKEQKRKTKMYIYIYIYVYIYTLIYIYTYIYILSIYPQS